MPQCMKPRKIVPVIWNDTRVKGSCGKGKIMKYRVVEKFVSINGEGRRAGQLAIFIRFQGCNLSCSYCDTCWANTLDVAYEEMTEEDIYAYIKEQQVNNVTLTGGEPLLQEGITILLERLAMDETLRVEIETNGSVDVAPFRKGANPPSFTIDYKLPDSGMTEWMCMDNFKQPDAGDTVKFVAGSMEDMEHAKTVMEEYGLIGKCSIYFSPVFGKIEPKDMVTFLVTHRLNNVNLQLQLHKFIWDPQERGV